MTNFELLLIIILGCIAFFHLLTTIVLVVLAGRGARLLGYVAERIGQFEHAFQSDRGHRCPCCKQGECSCCSTEHCGCCKGEERHHQESWVDLAAQFAALAVTGMEMWKGFRHRRR